MPGAIGSGGEDSANEGRFSGPPPLDLLSPLDLLTAPNYGDILAGLRIDDIAVEHVFLFCVSDMTFTTPNSARCSSSVLLSADAARWRADPIRRWGRRSTSSVRRATGTGATMWQGQARSGDGKMPDPLQTLADCQKARSVSI